MNPFCHGLPGLLALELDAESQTGASMTLAHVLAPAITMQDAGAWVVSQSLDECDVGQHTTMVRTELPAQDLAGREIHDEYYNCTRKIDPNCKEKYINEDLLCELLEPLIEKEVKKIRVTPKLQAKIDRHYAVAQNILRQYGVERPPATPLVEYSRYVLRSGSETEKTAFANGITNKIAVKNSELKLV